MKIACIIRRRGKALCAATFVAALIMGAVAERIAAAQTDIPTEGAEKETKQPDPAKEKRRTLTIDVILGEKNGRQPAADALVRIEGTDDWFTTNEQGRTKIPEISTGKVTLQIKVIGVDMCRLPGIAFTEGDQLVSVLVDKSQKGKCGRL